MRKKNIILLLPSFLLLLSIPFVIPIITTPDMTRYISLLSGAYTGEPCAEVVFMGYLFGMFCSRLYSICPSVEWYAVILFVSHLLSFLIIGLLVLQWKPQRNIVKYVVYFTCLVFFVYLTLILQYTVVSIELAASSLLLFADSSPNLNKKIIGILLFLVATQIRLESAFIPYMIAGPIFLSDFKLNDVSWWKLRLPLVAIFVVGLFTAVSNEKAYADEKWGYFKDYNEARGFLADNPLAEKMPATIHTKKDSLAYDLFYRYRLFDQNILTLNKIKAYQAFYQSKEIETIKWNTYSYFYEYSQMGGILMLIIVCWCLFELIKKRKISVIVQLSLVFALFLASNLYMMSNSFPKERVLIGTMFAFAFAVFCLAWYHVRHISWLLIVFCLFVIVKYSTLANLESKILLYSISETKEVEQMLSDCSAEKVMLPVPTQLSTKMFRASKSPICSKGVFQGWIHIFPKANLEYQPFTSFLNGFPILVKKGHMEQISIIRQLLLIHYGLTSELKTLQESEHYVMIVLERSDV